MAAKISLVIPGKYVARRECGKMARVLYDKLQEMKIQLFLMTRFQKNEAKNCKLPMDINIAFFLSPSLHG